MLAHGPEGHPARHGYELEPRPELRQAALFAGVRYIDTSESYENTRVESILGEVIERTGMRKDVYLVTKNAGYRHATGPAAHGFSSGTSSPASNDSAPTRRRLLHARAGGHNRVAPRPSVRAAFEALKKSGKIRSVV